MSIKLKALNKIFGMLKNMDKKQEERFEEAIKRRPLFKGRYRNK